MDRIDAFFSSYNIKTADAYDRALTAYEKRIARGMQPDDDIIRDYIKNAAAEWETEPVEGLAGLNPAQYIAGIDNLDLLFEMFDRAPIICDDELPGIYLEKLKSFGNEAVDRLLDIAGKSDKSADEDEYYLIPLMAIRLLGEWKIERAVPLLIELLDRKEAFGDNFDLYAEQVKSALVSIGRPAVELILAAVEQRNLISINEASSEYLLMALSEAGRTYRTDRTYRCLKNAFQAMENKVLGALCLKAYGDGRAVPALRGFLEKNRGNLEREDYYEILAAIKALGGNIEGL